MKKLLMAFGVVSFCTTTTYAKPKKNPKIQTGLASWYGKNLNGKKTASGEKLNSNEYTVAHRYLPFNSVVRITNKSNGKSVLARVNDRGPFIKNRIVDLTRKTADAIGMNDVASVKVEPLEIAQYSRKNRK